MKYTWTYNLEALANEERALFENAFAGYTPTGEVLRESWMEEFGRDGGSCGYVVFKHTAHNRAWTPYGMCRDCGDHYIIAKYTHYVRIDKKTMKVNVDVEDR